MKKTEQKKTKEKNDLRNWKVDLNKLKGKNVVKHGDIDWMFEVLGWKKDVRKRR